MTQGQYVKTDLGPGRIVMLGVHRRHVVHLSRQDMLLEMHESQMQPINLTQPA